MVVVTVVVNLLGFNFDWYIMNNKVHVRIGHLAVSRMCDFPVWLIKLMIYASHEKSADIEGE